MFGANLVIFQYHQNLTSIKINNESLSWSYWISVGGTSATFIATCALLIYTVYFKYLKYDIFIYWLFFIPLKFRLVTGKSANLDTVLNILSMLIKSVMDHFIP